MGMFSTLREQEKQQTKRKTQARVKPDPEEKASIVPTTRHDALPNQGENLGRTNVTTNVRTNERTFERSKIRHTFDIFADQLVSLKKLVIEREEILGDRVRIGDLVQEALDMLITRERNK